MRCVKKWLSILLVAGVIFCHVATIAVFASDYNFNGAGKYPDEGIFINGEELTPQSANHCDSTSKVIYVHSSINLSGNEPNATYVYCSGGGGGKISGAIAGGTVYSIAQMNSLGQTMWRQDLVSYNGSPLHHGTVRGPHQHNFTWSPYTNSSGVTFWNSIESIFALN